MQSEQFTCKYGIDSQWATQYLHYIPEIWIILRNLFESYKKKACVVQCGVIRQNFKYIFCEAILNMTRLYNI